MQNSDTRNKIEKIGKNMGKRISEFLQFIKDYSLDKNIPEELLRDIEREIKFYNIVVSKKDNKENDDDLPTIALLTNSWRDDFLENIRVFEDNIIFEYDVSSRYTKFEKILSQKEERNDILTRNIDIINIIPLSIVKQILIIPKIKLSLYDVLNEKFTTVKNHIIFINELCEIYNYCIIEKRMIEKLIAQYKNPIDNNGLKIDEKEKNQILSHVRNHVNSYNSTGLNHTLNEVLSELETGPCDLENIVSEGVSSVTSGNVMGMAQSVATKLSSKIESGEMNINELVKSSEMFINDLQNSDMLNRHPESDKIKDMFSSLMSTVKDLSKAHEEDVDAEGIDDILDKYI